MPTRSTTPHAPHTAAGLLLAGGLLLVSGPATAQPRPGSQPPAVQRLNAERARALTVRYEDGAGVRCGGARCDAPSPKVSTRALNEALRQGAEVRSCYTVPRASLERLMERAAKASGRPAPDLTQCLRLTLPEGASAAQVERAAALLRAEPGVEEVQPAPRLAPRPAITPDFSADQWHLASPTSAGHGFVPFWEALPQRGEGVRVVDVEVNFDAEHEDLDTAREAKTWPGCGTPLDFGPEYNLYYTDHGTASLGMVVAQHNGIGMQGLAPAAEPIFCSEYTDEYGYDHGGTILRVLDNLRPGDVILLEAQTPGPRYDYDNPESQDGLVPVEYNRPEFDAIRTASDLGVIIVEAGGNGAEDLDDPIYEGRFDREIRDSGALVVCAGNPPSGSFGPPRAAQYYTNYGARCDLQAYGAELYSVGYGDLFYGDQSPHRAYTAQFGGTSGASPQVTGAVVLLQSVAKARGGLLTPETARGLLQRTGEAQAGSRPIGPAIDVYAAALVIDAWLDGEPPALPGELEPCDALCQPGLRCDVEQVSGAQRCINPCEPFAQDTCAAGQACHLLPDGSGYCDTAGSGAAGDTCHTQRECGANLLCIEGNVCAPTCSLQSGRGCADDDDLCYPLGGEWGDIGLCLVVSSNPDGTPDGGACTASDQCQSGLCDTTLEGGYCFGLGCSSDADCHGGACIPGEIPQDNTCYGACDAHAACRPEHACFDGLCYPGPRQGCFADADCPDAMRCEAGACQNKNNQKPEENNNNSGGFIDDTPEESGRAAASCAAVPSSAPPSGWGLALLALLLGVAWRRTPPGA